MKLALVFLALLPIVLSGPVEEKRFLEFLHMDQLVHQLSTVVHSGMGHTACVTACHAVAGVLSPLCDLACTKALAALHGK
ncbi:hypothetical protein ACJMK2_017103 [Sinanodonta woodiana]|uniref:Uncharacterized protein n=1 Tax=Sinanodonta woodiana TaxID=1069815 RepID=A0ABD3UVU8_SINWO